MPEDIFAAITILRCKCGEGHPSALTLKPPGRFVCGNCLGCERGAREARCAKCRKIAPVHRHHVFGRKVSNETIEWCINCHRQPEQYLRPREAVFRVDYAAPPDQLELGRRLVAEYQVQKLTSCSTCHR